MHFEFNKNIDTQNHIFYNYYHILSKVIGELPNIICDYPGRENIPNIIYVHGSLRPTYVSNKLQIIKKTHTIQNVDFDAELLIEHQPITNGGNKIYVCFPLKTKSNNFEKYGEKNIIDFILQSHYNDNIEIELNDILYPEDKCFFYQQSNSSVFVFSKPILVNTSFSNIELSSHKDLVNITASSYRILRASQSHQYREGFEGMETMTPTPTSSSTPKPTSTLIKNDITEQWMECDNVPIDFAEEIPSYNVPIQSVLKSNISQMSETFTLMKNFVYFLFVFLLIYFVVPIVYKFMALRSYYDTEGTTDNEASRIIGLDLFLTLLFMTSTIFCFIYGSQITGDNKYRYYISAACIALFFITSFVTIYINKIIEKDNFFPNLKKSMQEIYSTNNFGKGFGNIFRSPYKVIESLSNGE